MIVREMDFEAPEYEIKMLRYNRIPKLLDLQVIEENEKKEYWYEITGLQSLSAQMELYPMNFLKLRELAESICDLKEGLERYFLEEENVWYSPELIFQDRRTRQFRYCYIPGSHTSKEGLKTLMEDVLNHLDHSDPQAVKAAYDIYERAATGNLGIRDLMRGILADPISGDPGNTLSAVNSEWLLGDRGRQEPGNGSREEAEGYMDDRREDPDGRGSRRSRRFAMPAFLVRHRQGRADDESGPDWRDGWEKADRIAERSAEPGYGETEYLDIVHRKADLQFIYQGTGREQSFSADHFPFLIGKEQGAVDQCLRSPAASRVHAKILENAGEFFLEDENSTNGTFLNGEILPYRTPVQLKKNDRVVFGTEEYTVVFGARGTNPWLRDQEEESEF